MKVKKILIENIAGISELCLDFDERMNFICGPNGIGKTTVLECVAHAFTNAGSNILKAKSGAESGNIQVKLEDLNGLHTVSLVVKDFLPEAYGFYYGHVDNSNKVLTLKTNRTFPYMALGAISRDSIKEASSVFSEITYGVNVGEVKNWFVNRFLFSAHSGMLSDEQLANFELAKKSFSLLSSDVSFSRVLSDTHDIMVKTTRGEIYYEYLSSGFKSCLSVVFGIIKDIEYRFREPRVKAADFDGLILIDELELHLHPEWQAKIADLLMAVFPKAQFIASTHSPHIIQNAKASQIIALALDGDRVFKRDVTSNDFGFQGWTVEEVLLDVMGMSSTRTPVYEAARKDFDASIEAENYLEALEAYRKLNELLHPDNPLRKLLAFDLASIQEVSSD